MANIFIKIDDTINIDKELNGLVTKITIETDRETYSFINKSHKNKDLDAIYEDDSFWD